MPLPAIPAAYEHEKMVYDVMEWIQALGDELLPTDPEWIIGKLRILLRTGGLAEQQRIIDYARAGDLLSHEALMREFHEMLNEDGKPPVSLRAYAAERHRHPQRGKGADWSVNLRRDFWIALLVECTCEAFGITAARNSESSPRRSRKHCGTDVVAEALRRSGYPLSEKAVADLFLKTAPTANARPLGGGTGGIPAPRYRGRSSRKRIRPRRKRALSRPVGHGGGGGWRRSRAPRRPARARLLSAPAHVDCGFRSAVLPMSREFDLRRSK